MKNEKWKPIEQFDGKYEVSNLGRVRSLKTQNGKPKILKQYKESTGYMRIGMSHKTKRDHISVHREVAKAFIPNPKNKPQINHKDSDKSNNEVSNLEWCTVSENMSHSWGNKTRTSPFRKGEKHIGAKLSKQDVIDIKNLLKYTNKTQSEIASKYPVTPSVISCINTGKYWSHIKIKEV